MGVLVYAICFLVIWPVYQFHVWNYPPQKQASDAAYILSSFGNATLTNMVVWASDKPILRPYAQYFLGVLMVTQRVTGGNTAYFVGEVSAAGWKTYFPTVYLIKETIVFHLLTLITLISGILTLKNRFWRKCSRANLKKFYKR